MWQSRCLGIQPCLSRPRVWLEWLMLVSVPSLSDRSLFLLLPLSTLVYISAVLFAPSCLLLSLYFTFLVGSLFLFMGLRHSCLCLPLLDVLHSRSSSLSYSHHPPTFSPPPPISPTHTFTSPSSHLNVISFNNHSQHFHLIAHGTFLTISRLSLPNPPGLVLISFAQMVLTEPYSSFWTSTQSLSVRLDSSVRPCARLIRHARAKKQARR